MARLPVLIRQNAVFDLVLAGKSYAEIGQRLDISDDTIARDMAAIGAQVQDLARARLGELMAVALASYQRIIDEAWTQYHRDTRRMQDWYAGRLDYDHESVVTKTLATEDCDDEADEDDEDGALAEESGPVEVKRTMRRVRPALQADRATWLRIVMDATREFCELFGIKKLIVEHSGPNGRPVEHVHLTLDEWKAQAAARLADAEATLAQFDEAGEPGDGDA